MPDRTRLGKGPRHSPPMAEGQFWEFMGLILERASASQPTPGETYGATEPATEVIPKGTPGLANGLTSCLIANLRGVNPIFPREVTLDNIERALSYLHDRVRRQDLQEYRSELQQRMESDRTDLLEFTGFDLADQNNMLYNNLSPMNALLYCKLGKKDPDLLSHCVVTMYGKEVRNWDARVGVLLQNHLKLTERIHYHSRDLSNTKLFRSEIERRERIYQQGTPNWKTLTAEICDVETETCRCSRITSFSDPPCPHFHVYYDVTDNRREMPPGWKLGPPPRDPKKMPR